VSEGFPNDGFVERAYREHRRQVFRFLLRKTGDHHTADDLTQRVFQDVLTAVRSQSNRPHTPLAWLYRIAERRFADEMRRQERHRRSTEQMKPLALHPRPEPYDRDTAATLRSAIGQLGEGQREVLVLKLLHGRSFAEIADLTQTSEGACKMRFKRALDQLRVILAEEGLTPL
jgi:RNA polymerase sigma factor (sigma-70 family)